jgi:hypothetical protein
MQSPKASSMDAVQASGTCQVPKLSPSSFDLAELGAQSRIAAAACRGADCCRNEAHGRPEGPSPFGNPTRPP